MEDSGAIMPTPGKNRPDQGVGLYSDACAIIDGAQMVVQRSVNVALVVRNWLLGRRIGCKSQRVIRARGTSGGDADARPRSCGLLPGFG